MSLISYMYSCTNSSCVYIYSSNNVTLHWGFPVYKSQPSSNTWVFCNSCQRRQLWATKKISNQPSPLLYEGQPPLEKPCLRGLGMTNPAPRNNVLLSGRNKWPRRPHWKVLSVSSTSGAFLWIPTQPCFFSAK